DAMAPLMDNVRRVLHDRMLRLDSPERMRDRLADLFDQAGVHPDVAERAVEILGSEHLSGEMDRILARRRESSGGAMVAIQAFLRQRVEGPQGLLHQLNPAGAEVVLDGAPLSATAQADHLTQSLAAFATAGGDGATLGTVLQRVLHRARFAP